VDQQGAGDDLSVPAAELANHRTMFGDDELKWPVRHGFRIGTTLLRSLAAGLALEVRHTAARLVGRFDVAPARALLMGGVCAIDLPKLQRQANNHQ
jgi:hypothetical protein